MLIKKLAIGAVGLSMFLLGPAAALVTPEPVRADSPGTCVIGCVNGRVAAQNQCRAHMPRLPRMDQLIDYGNCMWEADVVYDSCMSNCP